MYITKSISMIYRKPIEKMAFFAGYVPKGFKFPVIKSQDKLLAYLNERNQVRWIPALNCIKDSDVIPPPPPPEYLYENLYRTLHPYVATYIHDDGHEWPARDTNYPVKPNTGSFDVYSRLFTKPNDNSDGGAIKLTGNQWEAIKRKNNYSEKFENWAVGDDQRKVMRWKDGSTIPEFHYPLCFGGNHVNVLEFSGLFARIATWPAGRDVPDDLPDYFWQRIWCIYSPPRIADAPIGAYNQAAPAWMLALSHLDSAWIYHGGLMR